MPRFYLKMQKILFLDFNSLNFNLLNFNQKMKSNFYCKANRLIGKPLNVTFSILYLLVIEQIKQDQSVTYRHLILFLNRQICSVIHQPVQTHSVMH